MVHFLVTRFNLRTSDWQFAKDGSQVLTKEWMKDRWHLFNTYCIPSVINQTNQNFTWFVFFDTYTAIEYKEKITKLSLSFPNFKPIYIENMNVFQKSIKSNILNNFSDSELKSQQKIITTRLDNDDIVHENFVDRIQQLAKNTKHDTVIDLRNGYQMELYNSIALKKINLKFNPFISVVEDLDKLETVISKTHVQWQKSKNVKIENTEFLWIQLIHKKNKLNTTLKNFYYTSTIPKGFMLKNDLKMTNKTTTNLKNVCIYFRNSLKAFVNLTIKKI